MSTDAAPAYRKFGRQLSLTLGVAQMWEAPDHLLAVNSLFGVESYRRFYFREIQALIIRPTSARRNWIIVLAIGLGIFSGVTALLLYFSFRDVARHPEPTALGFAMICGVPALISLAGLVMQLVLGPTCQTFLQLRTGLEELSYFNRMRSAVRMRARLTSALAEKAEAAPILP